LSIQQIEHGLPPKLDYFKASSIATSVEIASSLQDQRGTSSKIEQKRKKKDWLLNQ
jgi:hypothetical protein